MGRPPMGEDRIEQIRHDTAFVQQRLTKARKLIFEGKASIGSKKIEDELQFASLIPARVSFFILLKCRGIKKSNNMCLLAESLLKKVSEVQFRFLFYIRARCHARIRLGPLESYFFSSCANFI